MNPSSSLSGRRILFVLCGFELGGAERQALTLARHLKSQGCAVTVWGHHHRHVGPERVIAQCEAAGIPWAECKFRWPCGRLALVRGAWRLWRGLQRERPDAILAYTTWPNVGCGLVWRWSPAKAFVWGQRDCAGLRGSRLERRAYRAASAVICNAAHEIDYLHATLGQATAPVHVVHNGTAEVPPQRTRAAWRTELGVPGEAPVVTMLANFRRHQKDHPTVLRAWRRVLELYPAQEPRPHLVLAGAPQGSDEAVRRLAGELGILDGTHFAGHVMDVAGLLAASDVGVLASPAEGLPNAVIEYMMAGLPVVATDVAGNREVLGPDPLQPCVPVGDAESLARQINVFATDAGRRRTVGSRNRARARDTFAVETMCASMQAILSGLLDATDRR